MGTASRLALGAVALVALTGGIVAAGVVLQQPTTARGVPVRLLVPSPAAAETTPPPDPVPTFDKTAHSTKDADSIWVVVNKKHPIHPLDFEPDTTIVRGYQVADPVAGPLSRMLAASDRRGLGFKIASAFRSYGYQQVVYANTVAAQGQEAADRLSARPGFSEHQTGLAVDLVTPATPACDFAACFATTRAGRWLTRHSWDYGFVVRYQAGTRRVTGYAPEPWHLRYVGRPLAAELRRTHTRTLEQFFGVTGGGYR